MSPCFTRAPWVDLIGDKFLDPFINLKDIVL